MPVAEGVFEPRVELVAAEQAVRWRALNAHILRRRAEVDAAAVPLARRAGYLIGAGVTPKVQLEQLEQVLRRELRATFAFGRDQATREIRELRTSRRRDVVRAAREGDAAPERARRRFDRLAAGVVAEVEAAAREAAGQGEVAASGAAGKALHRGVLEVVGTSLNLGRTHGALTAPGGPPTFAMRSEQLDRNTCSRCEQLHGSIYQVDGDEFYANLPPAGCFGGGRCRGVVVFADGVRDLERA